MDRTAHFEPGYLIQASAQTGFVNLCLRNDTRYGLRQPRWVEAPKIGDGPGQALWLAMGDGLSYNAPKMGKVYSFRSTETLLTHAQWSREGSLQLAMRHVARHADLARARGSRLLTHC